MAPTVKRTPTVAGARACGAEPDHDGGVWLRRVRRAGRGTSSSHRLNAGESLLDVLPARADLR